MADEFPFKAWVNVGGTKKQVEDLKIDHMGKVTYGGKNQLITKASAQIKGCQFTYNDPNDKDLKFKPECCISFENNTAQKEQICSTSEKFCAWEILSILKKLKLTCDKEPLKSIASTTKWPTMFMETSKPLSPV